MPATDEPLPDVFTLASFSTKKSPLHWIKSIHSSSQEKAFKTVFLSHCPLLVGVVTSYARNCEWTSDVTSQRQSKAKQPGTAAREQKSGRCIQHTGHDSQGAEIRGVHTAYSTHLGCAEVVLAVPAGRPRCCTPGAPVASAEATPHSVSSHGSKEAAAVGLEATTAITVQPNPRRHSI
jgi:hypothetical protein